MIYIRRFGIQEGIALPGIRNTRLTRPAHGGSYWLAQRGSRFAAGLSVLSRALCNELLLCGRVKGALVPIPVEDTPGGQRTKSQRSFP